MSGFQHNNQQWAYSDGQQNMEFHQQSTSWSSQGASSGSLTSPLAQMPAVHVLQQQQRVIPAQSFHDQYSQMHSQMMAQAQQHHQAISQSIQRSFQQNMQTANSVLRHQPNMPALPASAGQWGQQQQLDWTESAPTPQPPPGEPLQLTAPGYEPECLGDGMNRELEHRQAEEAQRREYEEHQRAEGDRGRKEDRKRRKEAARDRKAFEDRMEQNNKVVRDALAAQQAAYQEILRHQEEIFARERENPEERRRRDAQAERERRQAENRERERDVRLARMEGEARERKEREAADKEIKEREIEALRRQLERERQQNLEAERRHGRELASLAAKASHAQPPAQIDMSATRKIIDELHSQQPRTADIAKLVEDIVSKQLRGVARTGALESSVTQVQKALGKLSSSASAGDIQMAVTKGIDEVMQRAMATQQQRQQGRIEASPAQQQAPRAQTSYATEERPNEPKSSKSRSKTKALPTPASQPAAEARPVQSGGSQSSMSGNYRAIAKGKRSSSHTGPDLKAKSVKAEALDDALALAKVKKPTETGKAAASSSLSILEQAKPDLSRTKAPKMLTAGGMTGVPAHPLQAPSESRSVRSAQPTETNALAKVRKPATTDNASTLQSSAMTPKPSESNAMARSKHPAASANTTVQQRGVQAGSTHIRQLTYPTETGTECSHALVRQKEDVAKKPRK